MYIFEKVFAKRILGARAKGRGDATTDDPEVSEIGVIAEDMNPNFGR